MKGLVLEGGTFRPIFSSGVMDALLTEGIMILREKCATIGAIL